jgi:hypothetical protein
VTSKISLIVGLFAQSYAINIIEIATIAVKHVSINRKKILRKQRGFSFQLLVRWPSSGGDLLIE